jgi:hypothetical protein
MTDSVLNPFGPTVGLGSSSETTDNSFDALVAQQAKEARVISSPPIEQQVQTSLSQAVKTNPDAEARLRKQAATAGIPIVAARQFPKETDEAAHLSSYNYPAIAANSPATAKTVSNFSNAQVMHDDLRNAAETESTLSSVLRAAPDFTVGVVKGVTNLGFQAFGGIHRVVGGSYDAASSALGYGKPFAAEYPTILGGERQVSDWLTSIQSPAWQQSSKDVEDAHGWHKVGAILTHPLAAAETLAEFGAPIGLAGKLTVGAIQGLSGAVAVRTGVLANASINSGLTGLGAGLSAEQQVAQMTPEDIAKKSPMYASLIAKGSTPDDALAQTIQHAGVIGNVVGMGAAILPSLLGAGVNTQLISRLAGRTAASMTVGRAALAAPAVIAKEVGENAGNMAAFTGASNLGVQQSGNTNQPLSQGVADSAITGGMIGAVMGGVAAGSNANLAVGNHFINKAYNKAYDTATDRLNTINTIGAQYDKKAQQADTAQTFAQHLVDLDQQVAESKTKERSPEVYGQLIDNVLENAPNAKLYIDAQVLHQTGLADQITSLSPDVAEQYPNALATGSTVAIPVKDYVMHIAGTDLSKALIPHLTNDPANTTLSEAHDFATNGAEDFKAEVAKALAEIPQDNAFTQSHAAVKQNIKQQLIDTGHYTDKAADTNATLAAAYYATHAARSGISPEDVLTKYSLNIVGQHMTGDHQYNQTAYHGSMEKFDNLSTVHIGSGRGDQLYGHGIYLSTSRPLAELYAKPDFGRDDKGHVYSVDIPDDHEILDWNKNLSDQSESIKAAIDSFGLTLLKNANGEVIYEALSKKLGSDKAASDALNEAGVKGLKYESVTHDNHHNFVIFNDASMRVLKRDSDPNQIKSASGNNGEFSPKDNNIYHQSANDLVATHQLTENNLLHAEKMGGLAAPSLAITKADQPLHSFGDITLVGDRHLIDPKNKAQVFGSDVYSPRYPEVEHQVLQRSIDRLNRDLSSHNKAVGGNGGFDASDLGRNPAKKIEDSSAVMHQFLESKGIVPDVKTEQLTSRQQELVNDSKLNKFIGRLSNAQDLSQNGGFQSRLEDMEKENYRNSGRPQEVIDRLIKSVDDNSPFESEQYAYKAARDLLDAIKKKNYTAPDRYETKRALYAQIEAHNVRPELAKYAEKLADSLDSKQRIFKGFNANGNRVYAPHTLENVVKMLKQDIRGGESFNYGVGSTRAKLTPKFKSVEAIRKSKDRLVTEDQFNRVKEETNFELTKLSGQLAQFHGASDHHGFTDAVLDVVAEAPSRGIDRALELNGFKNVDENTKKAISDFTKKLIDMPTEYFEAKLPRPVGIHEFKGAIIPHDLSQEARDVLTKNGITEIREYKSGDKQERAKTLADFAHHYFQGDEVNRGSFDPASRTITLLENANLSTFIHELGHFFFENHIDMATEMLGKHDLSEHEQSISNDVSAILRNSGINGTPEQQLAQWHSMSFEEKRAAHEQTAESFEHYLLTGKAPSLELSGVFQTMRGWMLTVYKSIKQFLGVNPEAGKLNDEVKGVFERMLATNEQIALAEKARSMMPLFANPEEMGNTIPEFAAYHNLGTDATLKAQQELSEKGLRDMQWLGNKQSKMVKTLQAQHKALRAETMIDARHEVMQQPINRAYQFLTNRIKPEDKLVPFKREKSDPNSVDYSQDSLFEAIAKLGGINKEAAVKEWGVDPKASIKAPVFGKPVLRKEGGRSIGEMEEVLLEHGYVSNDEHGKAQMHDLMERFDQEMRGDKQYSEWVDPNKLSEEQRTGERYNLAALGASRFDEHDLKNMGLPDDVVQKLTDLKMVQKKGGIDPELVAELFGFNSAHELATTLSESPSPKEATEALTDQMMLERHGEISTPDRLHESAEAAIHNDVRTRFIATELNALNKMLGGRKVLLEAAKEYVNGMISGLKVRDILPHQYTTAEARGSIASEKAFKAGDTQKAAAEKRNQLINSIAAREAVKTLAEVDKALNYFKKFDNPKYATKVEIESRAQIYALLAQYDFRKVQPTDPKRDEVNLQDWLDAQIEAGYSPVIPNEILNPKNPPHYKDMTVEQLRGLRDSIEAIEKVGREMKMVTVDGVKRDLNDLVNNELIPKMTERGNHFSATELNNKPEKRSDNAMMVALMHFGSWLRSAQSQVKPQEFKRNFLDRHEILGPFGKAIFERAFAANYHKIDMLKSVSDDFEAMGKSLGREWQDSLLDALPNKTLIDPDEPLVDGKPVYLKMKRSDLLGIAIHFGNESNFDKVARGWGWDKNTLYKFVDDNMTKDDWIAAKAAGDVQGKHWNDIVEMNNELGNVSPEKIEARPFMTRHGEMDGWYSVIRYDPLRSKRGQKEEGAVQINENSGKFGTDYFRADSTTNGSLNKRNAGYTDRVDLDYHYIANAINESLHDLAYRRALIDIMKILKHPDFRAQFKKTYGNEQYLAMQHWVGNIANSVATDRSLSALNKFLASTRTGIVVSGIGFRVTTMLKHGGSAAVKSAGYFPGASKAIFLKRVAAMGTNYRAEIAGAIEKFPEIRARLMQQDRDYKLLQANMFEPESAMGKAHRFGHAGVAWFDMMSAVPTAWAAYDRAVTTGIPVREGGTGEPMTEDQAVMYASKIVREAHGSNIESARSLVMNTNNEGVKMFTTLYGFMNNTYGQATDILDKFKTAGIGNPELLGRAFAALLMPAMVAGAVSEGVPSDDKGGVWHWMAKAIAGEAAGTLPFVRDAYTMVEAYQHAGQVGAESWMNTMVQPLIDAYKIAVGKEVKRPISDVANAVGTGLHIPGLSQAGATAQYLHDEYTGDQPEPDDFGDVFNGVIKGHANKKE